MITYITGDIFDSDAQAYVNTVNTMGIMGKGLALQFKERFPDNYEAYREYCKMDLLKVGGLFVYSRPSLINPKVIINFATKGHWKNKSNLVDIERGLEALLNECIKLKIDSIAIPPLGAGLGGLPWEKVQMAIEKTFAKSAIDVRIYPPLTGKNPSPRRKREESTLALSDKEICILAALLYYSKKSASVGVTLIEAHKVLYFFQEVGKVNLNLKYTPYKMGPYCNNLRFVFQKLEKRFIDGFGDGTMEAFDSLTLLPAAQRMVDCLTPEKAADIQEGLEKLNSLIGGFETPVGLEMLSTLYFLIKKKGIPPKEGELRDAMSKWCSNHQWGKRKNNIFSDTMIELGIERLQHLEV